MKLTPLLFCLSAIIKQPLKQHLSLLTIGKKYKTTSQKKILNKEIEKIEKEFSDEINELCKAFIHDMHTGNFKTLEHFAWNGRVITDCCKARIAMKKRKNLKSKIH